MSLSPSDTDGHTSHRSVVTLPLILCAYCTACQYHWVTIVAHDALSGSSHFGVERAEQFVGFNSWEEGTTAGSNH